MSEFWKNKKVTVTGGGGFIGSHLCEALCAAGAIVTSAGTSEGHIAQSALKDKIRFLKTDLFDYKQTAKNFEGQDMIMHLAARVGGIEYNMKYMAEVYADNLLMLSTVTKSILENGIKEALFVSSACVYPHDAIVPTPETEGFRSDPEETNEGYGWAKRSLELSARFLKKYKGIRVAVVRPYNAYGPRDKFDPKHSHVVAALINKVYNSADGTIQVWGSGNQTRALLYVKDAVRGMMLAAEKYPEADPINLGNDREYKISEVVEAVIRQSGMKIRPVYDTSKPEGYVRRSSLNQKAKEKIGFETAYDLERGLKETIEYYLEHIKNKDA
jgi:GDP-L-fucose synthase